MAITVFYSWQSDRPNSTNRTFIEEALKKAIKEVSEGISVQEAERDSPLELDKDTQGIPGIVPGCRIPGQCFPSCHFCREYEFP